VLSLFFPFFPSLLTFDRRCRLEQLVIRHQIVVRCIKHIAHIVLIRRENLGLADRRIWGHSYTCTHLFCHLRDLRGRVEVGRTICDVFVGL